MARRIFIFDPPDRFVAGAIGAPGRRTFYLQARAGERIVSVTLEKVQVAVLAERLGRLLEELEEDGEMPALRFRQGHVGTGQGVGGRHKGGSHGSRRSCGRSHQPRRRFWVSPITRKSPDARSAEVRRQRAGTARRRG